MIDFFRQINFTNAVGIFAGVFTSVSMLPQLIKTFKKKKSEEISILMIVTLIIGIAGWIYYGILREDYPLLFTNAFSILVNITLLVLHFKYKK